MLPSFHDLVYFAEAASSQNLSRAAERLGLTQPSLTLAIQRLESTIGTPLLIRSKRGVALTQAGKQLLAQARALTQQWQNVKTRALASTSEIRGSYVLGCHASVGRFTLGRFLPALLDKHPELELRLVHDLSRKIAEAVIRMEIDVGITVNPVRHPDLVIRKLAEDDVGLWTGPGARRSQDLRSGEGVLICDPDLLQSQLIIKALRAAGLKYRRILASSSLEVIAELAAEGAGMGILPSRVARGVGGGRLRSVSKSPLVRDEICVLYRAENRGVRSIHAIAEAAAAAALG